MLKNIKTVITSKIGRQVLIGQKHSPTVLFAAGVVGVVATVVLASKATLKVESIIDEAEEKIEKAKAARELNIRDYTEANYKRDMGVIYTQSALKLAKLYAPAVIVGVVSIGALAGSHQILSRRNAALTAAYAGLDKAFREYRRRVVEEIGEEKERELRFAPETREIVEIDENGEEVKKIEKVVNPNGLSPYARCFDKFSKSWSPQPGYNRTFLQAQQNYANQMLRSKGHVFLNEIYDMLGLDRTKEGAVVGWIYESNRGDGYIDFGFFDHNFFEAMRFVVGDEDCVWLDFNVDGVIYDQI